jgi:hypothetical protein
MPQIQRMRPAEISEMRELLVALKSLKGFAPHNKAVLPEAFEAVLKERDARSDVEILKENEASSARDATAKSEKRLRELRKIAREQVSSQYGADSEELASLGLKKASEYKRRTPRAPKVAPTA